MRPETVATPSALSHASASIIKRSSLNLSTAPGMHMTHPVGDVTAGGGVPSGAPRTSTNAYATASSGQCSEPGLRLPGTPDVTLFAAIASAVGQPHRMRRSSCLSTGVPSAALGGGAGGAGRSAGSDFDRSVDADFDRSSDLDFTLSVDAFFGRSAGCFLGSEYFAARSSSLSFPRSPSLSRYRVTATIDRSCATWVPGA
mmetsp:Transcript_3376/g.13415  ORF Transcript_3376/g.13415 Transcript_3376/m.13415 type:complete len:200 (+) Transcript_3376:391-990(+)